MRTSTTYSTCMLSCVSLFTDLEQQRRQAEADKKVFEDLVRERDLLSKVGLDRTAILRAVSELIPTPAGIAQVRGVHRET